MIKQSLSIIYFFCLLSISGFAVSKDFSKGVIQRPSLLKPDNIGVVYNEDDPKSVEISHYYLKARNIPIENLIPVKLPVESKDSLNEDEFNRLKQSIEAKASPSIQVLVLMWQRPFSVNCNSITSAITLGYHAAQCKDICAVGKNNPYFNSRSLQPFTDHKMRLSMMLPTESVSLAKAIIDRGVLSEFNLVDATGYFLKTSDRDRSGPRERFFPTDLSSINVKRLKLRSPRADSIKNKKDIMFYFTGVVQVADLNTNTFLPGAIADHLTSFGGYLKKDYDSQMQSTKWLEAGATATYGSVVEPCNYWQKFPNPQVVLSHYLSGETLVESYWKSVMWPTQGLFLGEPLAAPYKKYDLDAVLNESDDASNNEE